MTKKSHKKKPNEVPNKEKIESIDNQIESELDKFKEKCNNINCFPLFLDGSSINHKVVDSTFDKLRDKYGGKNEKLCVILDSGGGNIDSAYNLALLFRRYGTKKLEFIIPRWAKSAATLLALGGDKIFMGPVAELGPIDPQITQMNPLEGRVESFSPLHIESTLELIRNEFDQGNEKLAKNLIERLQFPLTLGSFKKSLDIGRQYIVKLLSTRMLKKKDGKEMAKEIAYKLTEGYADHGFCIDCKEAINLGLNVEELDGEELNIIWSIHNLNKQKRRIKRELKEQEMMDKIQKLPPDILDKLPPSLEKEINNFTIQESGK